MSNDTSSEEIDRDDLESAKEFIELLHGANLKDGYDDNDETKFATAEGMDRALNVIEQVLGGEWDTEMAEAALADGDADVDELVSLSRRDRNTTEPVQEHPAVARVTGPEARSYRQLITDIFR